MDESNLKEQILRLKAEKKAIILAHNYQVEEVQAVADFIGDSLELSRMAATASQQVIVFAGVKFMAETAKILSPQKKVYLPRLDAGCPMADMITVEELRDLKKANPRAKVVTYVNSSVEVKAESDVCCTSANAVAVVKNIPAEEIIFVPDMNLGAYVQRQVPGKKLILHEGYCYVHNRIKAEEVQAMKDRFPQALVIVHPETRLDVIDLADEVLSTSGMLKFAASSPAREFIVGTEQDLINRMQRENPGKKFYPVLKARICVNMKRTALIDIKNSLEKQQYEILVDPDIARKAVKSLNEMLKYK